MVGDGGEMDVKPLEDVGAGLEGAVVRREGFLEGEEAGGGVGVGVGGGTMEDDEGPSGGDETVVWGTLEHF